MLCSTQAKKLGKLFHWAEWSYNKSIHSAIRLTPFQMIYEKQPSTIPTYIAGLSNIETIDSTLLYRDELLAFLRDTFLKSQKIIKTYDDSRRTDVDYEIRDWLYLYLQPYRQQTISHRVHHKFSPRYFGPFQIVKKINPVAYQLDLPPNSKVRTVFHVSLLKSDHGPIPSTSLTVPPSQTNRSTILKPKAILDHKTITVRSHHIEQVLLL